LSLGFEQKKPKKKKTVKNPYENYGKVKKINPGNFKGNARERLLSCANPDKELGKLIGEAYEIFDKKIAKKVVKELHLLRNELYEKDGITKRDVKNLW